MRRVPTQRDRDLKAAWKRRQRREETAVERTARLDKQRVTRHAWEDRRTPDQRDRDRIANRERQARFRDSLRGMA